MRNIGLMLFHNSELPILLIEIILAFALICLFFRFVPVSWKKETVPPKTNTFIRVSRRKPVWTKRDWLYCSLITVIYAIVSFHQLGSNVFPVTTWQPEESPQSLILHFTEATHFDAVYAIYGEGDNNSNPTTYQLGMHEIALEGSNDLSVWEPVATLDGGSIYQYQITQGDWEYSYIRVTSSNRNDTLTELGFKAYGAERLLSVEVEEDAHSDGTYPAGLLIDEQDLVSLDPTYYNEGYFDEVYHPRNAWEIANGQHMYASVHPLLGTTMIALSIKLFGMNPFAWRFPGALVGVMLIPLFYALCKELFRRTRYCAWGTILLASDFMHLTTSRIGTLEPFSVFFILFMFLYMIRYYYTGFYDTPLKDQLKLLFMSGLMMGLGIATKWTACYSAVGLAVLLFSNLFQRWREYSKATKKLLRPQELDPRERQLCRIIRDVFLRNFMVTIAWCFVFFVFIPVIIYCVSYIPTPVWRDGWSVANVWKQVMYIFNYHTNLEATHPYQSTWYQWILDLRPIWYFGRADRSDIYHSIACFSNPLLCWAGFFSIFHTVWHALRYRDREAYIIVIGYLTAYLPWVSLVQRCVFAYHFYPTSFFMILSVVHTIRTLLRTDRKYLVYVRIFTALCVLLFFMFLPATAGFGTDRAYIHFLEWLPGWYFG